MRCGPLVFLLVAMLAPHWLRAQAAVPAATDTKSDRHAAERRMFIEPSSTHVSLGKASLTVSPLNYREKTYVGGYALTVVPYFFKNEKGMLKFEAPDVSMQKLCANCVPVNFTGRAVNGNDGRIKVILGKAIPITNDKGTVSVWIVTDNGMMVFNTTYHFAP